MKRKSSVTDSTLVVKMGIEFFTTSDTNTETEDVQTTVESTMDEKDEKELKKSKREKKNGRFYRFVKRHFLQRKGGSNDVKEIHIIQEGDELKWARRSGGSGVSRSSEETVNSEEDRLEIVHDMAEDEVLHV